MPNRIPTAASSSQTAPCLDSTCGAALRGQVAGRALRRLYRSAGWLWLLTDRARAQTAPQPQALADWLRIRFVWLPRQAPELSPMDQLWRDLKRLIAANRQATSIDALAADATTGMSQGRYGIQTLLAQKPVAELLATYLVHR